MGTTEKNPEQKGKRMNLAATAFAIISAVAIMGCATGVKKPCPIANNAVMASVIAEPITNAVETAPVAVKKVRKPVANMVSAYVTENRGKSFAGAILVALALAAAASIIIVRKSGTKCGK